MILIKKSYLYFGLLAFLLSSCTPLIDEEKSRDYSLQTFNLRQSDINGIEIFKLLSLKANIDPIKNIVEAYDVNITSNINNNFFNNIISKYSLLDRNNNTLLLRENITLNNLNDSDSFIKTDNLLWKIDENIIIMNGNIELSYLSYFLKSNTAIYNRSEDEILFNGISNYKLYSDNSDKSSNLIDIITDKVKVNYKTKKIEFISNGPQIKSVVHLKLN